MPLRIAIVGHGRVGCAFARGFVRAGADVLGFLGRDEDRARAAAADLGAGAGLKAADLDGAHCVVFAVGDGQLEGAVSACAAAGGRRCSLWLHTSGRHGLEVFEPARPLGVRTGSLHPVAPFSPSVEAAAIAGAPAVCQGGARSRSLLARLCRMLALEPIFCEEHDRVLYHAACALAANGAAALFGLAEEVLHCAGGPAGGDASRIVSALMTAAVTGAQRHGASASLSGPVRRGDAETVRAHRERLSASAPAARAAYEALMTRAAQMSEQEGLAPELLSRVLRALSPGGPPWRS